MAAVTRLQIAAECGDDTPTSLAGAVTTAQMAAGAITTPAYRQRSRHQATSQCGCSDHAISWRHAGHYCPTLGVTTAQGFITVPSGMVAIFTSACPAVGHGLRRSTTLSRWGDATYGTSGGSATTSHTSGAPYSVPATAVAFTSSTRSEAPGLISPRTRILTGINRIQYSAIYHGALLLRKINRYA